MNTINKFFFFFLMITGLSITACVDNNFDEPQNTLNINDEEVVSISELLDMMTPDGVVLDDAVFGGEVKYLKGTVTADDASGNFFKTVTFQDESGALSIMADRNELNAEFPAGSIIYIRLNALTLGEDAGLPRLGHSIVDDRLQRIPDPLVNDFLIAGGPGVEVVPEVVTIEDILQNSDLYYNKLVVIEQAQFTLGFVGQTFADPNNPAGPASVNTIIEDCNGDEIIVRNSGFSDFASDLVPSGSGRVTAVVGVFLDDLQMFIRDLDDLDFMTERCDGSGGQAADEVTIDLIKERFYVSGADAAPVGFITGTVISDRNSGQINSQNIIVQNGEHGILVRFTGDHSYNLGDQVKITVSGQEVSEFRGILQINNVPSFNAERTGSATLPAPREITIDEILLDNNRFESTRVLIKNATLSGGATYGVGNITVDDGTETINIFTFSSSSYANDAVPSGVVEVTAIVGQFDDDPQLVINSSSDVSGGSIDPGGDSTIDEGFVGEFREPIALTGWMNIATKGTRQWYYSNFDDENFAECEGFQDPEPETEAWLITPTIDTDESSMFSFETQQAFWQHQGLSVWISQDFTNFEDANWVSLDQARIANNSDEQFEWVASGKVDLKDYFSGDVRVAFKYEGNAAANTTKMRIDNVLLE